MNRFTMSNLALLMSYKINRREIDKMADKLNIERSDNMQAATEEAVRVAAAQLMINRYGSPLEYLVDMNLYVGAAVNKRAQLVCFPAYTGVLPASFLPQYDQAMPGIRPLVTTGMPDIQVLHETLSYFSDFMFDAYYFAMSALAARHGIYIMAGTALYFAENELVHRAFLFNDLGDLVGFQDKISLNPLEQALRIEPASELKVFETAIGNLAILIGEDADYFETGRIAKNLGADILLCPTVFIKEQSSVDMALGPNMRSQENHIFCAQSVLVGDTGLGFSAEGCACLFAPNELLAHKNGIIAQTTGRFEPDIACATLNQYKIWNLQSPYTDDKNPELLRKYFDRLY